ncbi:hypothetical protein [Comamonas sp.]
MKKTGNLPVFIFLQCLRWLDLGFKPLCLELKEDKALAAIDLIRL